MRTLSGGLVVLMLLAGCEQAPQVSQPADAGRRDSQPDKYARDRELCRAQVAEAMRTRRRIDDSRREVVAGNWDRYGQGALPTEMADLSDQRSADRMLASCMEARGWPQPKPPWYQRGTFSI